MLDLSWSVMHVVALINAARHAIRAPIGIIAMGRVKAKGVK